MDDLLIGQVLAICLLLYALSFMVGGKSLSAKLSRGLLRRIKRMVIGMLRWTLGRVKALLR